MIFTHTRTGDNHLKRNKLCDDAVIAVSYEDYSLLLSFDGCSSSVYGGESARWLSRKLADLISHPDILLEGNKSITASEFMQFCLEQGNEEKFMNMILKRIAIETDAMCEHYHCPRKDLCTTLIAALVKFNPDTRTSTAVILTVGDGFVAAYNSKTSESTLVSPGENRNSNPNMTYFCTSYDAAEHAHVYRIENFDGLLISTDGVTHAVNINDPAELSTLMGTLSSFPCLTDTEYSVLINHTLTTIVQNSHSTRDLNDDCGTIYYTTNTSAVSKHIKKIKSTYRRK